ncbi:hypothetical protein [Bombiscardovia coagulans]|uniref:Uncharacterized protein n=1 Tax=Bombiscardovia coagulans TaxID=686666 RepID=A0A261ESQ7_9BIFI|nr:hypothetical protein [Bombiscardovia coagulans]OZG49865.1 hypothetical protein BOCO_0382 [Bombiscardovia coagulans]
MHKINEKQQGCSRWFTLLLGVVASGLIVLAIGSSSRLWSSLFFTGALFIGPWWIMRVWGNRLTRLFSQR